MGFIDCYQQSFLIKNYCVIKIKTMTESEIYFKNWTQSNKENKYVYDCMQAYAESYHETQLKAKMPSSQKVNKEAARIYKEAWEADYAIENFITGVIWLKQQILKP